MRYKYLFFDGDDTLFDFKRCERSAVQAVLRRHGLPAGGNAADAYSRINDGYWKLLEQGRVRLEDLMTRRFADLLALLEGHEGGRETAAAVEAVGGERLTARPSSLRAAELNRDYVEALGERAYLLPGAEALLRELFGTYHLILITNGLSAVQRSRLDRSPIRNYLEAAFISSELGVAKPDPAYFDAVCQALGIPVEQRRTILVIGDSLTADIQGAVRSGLDSCWFNPFNKERTGAFTPTMTINRLDGLLRLLKER